MDRMHIPFDMPQAIDLTDFFPTREEHNRAIHRMHKRLNRCKKSVFFLAALAGVSAGMIMGAIGEQKKRIDDLEEILKSGGSDLKKRRSVAGIKDEMAG